MKNRPVFALLLLTILCCMPSPASAQTNHSLEWGVEVGEQFTYALQRAYFADPYQRAAMELELPWLQYINPGQKAILEVSQLDTIAEQINSSYDMPVGRCRLLRENDSAQIATQVTNMLIPIGDWDFLTEIGNITDTEGLTLIDTASEWGTVGRGSYQAPGGSVVNAYIEIRYEKTNGTLSYLRYRYSALGSDLIDVVFVHWYPGMPTLIGGEIQVTTILIIALVGVVGVIVAIVSYRFFRGRKSLAQRLGE